MVRYKGAVSLKRRLLTVSLGLFLIVGILLGLFFYLLLEQHLTSRLANELEAHVDLMVKELSTGNKALKKYGGTISLEWLSSPIEGQPDLRITVIAQDGKVLSDTHYDPDKMENHLSRPEVQLALKEQSGVQIHVSRTLGVPFMYFAKTFSVRDAQSNEEQFIMRAAFPMTTVNNTLKKMRLAFIGGLLLCCAAAVIVLNEVAKRITRPISSLTDFTDRVACGARDLPALKTGILELDHLFARFNEMADVIEKEYRAIETEKQKLRTILQGMREGIVVVDEAGRVILLNAKAGEIFKISERDLLWKRLGEFYAGFELTGILEELNENREKRRSFTILATRRTYDLSVFPVLTTDGNVAACAAVLTDITEREELDTVRREFVANASHELRTPVAVLQSTVEALLAGGDEDPSVRNRFLNNLAGEVERLKLLIRDLLDLSRAEQYHLEQPLSQFIAPLVEEVINEFRISLSNTDLIEWHPVPEGIKAQINPEDLKTIIRNLLENALKYSPKDSPVIVGIKNEVNKVLIYVSDKGPGIPKEVQERIFERFYRIEKDRSRTKDKELSSSGGTGLGLSIVKHLIERAGGAVWVESEEGHGATFKFTLPLIF